VHLADVALAAWNHAGWVVKTPQLVRRFSGGITHLNLKTLYHRKNWNKKTHRNRTGGIFRKISSNGWFDVHRINDANDDGDHTRAFILHHLPRAAALIEHQDGIPDASLGIIERDKITAVIIFIKDKRLYNEQPPMFVIRVADGGDNSSNNFSNDHDFM
jgi:hypothetical protein